MQFIKERHQNNYLIFNLSGRKYDYSKFDDKVNTYSIINVFQCSKVLEYFWQDHNPPSISVLFNICLAIHNYLNGFILN